jgi:hypothetical protein
MVGQIKAYRFSNKFKKQHQNLPIEIRQAFNEKLGLFLRMDPPSAGNRTQPAGKRS